MDSLVSAILAGARPRFDEVRDAWSGQLSYLNRLEETPQNPVWHGEGNVAIHTGMVMEELFRELDQADFTPREQATLVLAAALHDIAKCITTREQPDSEGKPRIVSPRHADKGRSYLALRLLDLGLPSDIFFGVLDLVGHHHNPIILVHDDAKAARFRKLARHVDTRLVYHLERADLRGRICEDQQEQLEILELFRLGCQEAEAFGGRRPFQREIETVLRADFPSEKIRQEVAGMALRDLEGGLIFTGEEAVARSYGYLERPAGLTLLVGPSGSGKSAWTAQHGSTACDVVSLDALREEHHGRRSDQSDAGTIVREAKERLRASLRAGRHAIWDATNLHRDRRRGLISLARDYGASTRIVTFAVSPQELWQRNKEREHPVPESVLARQLERLDWPYAHEADSLHVVGANGEEFEPWRGYEPIAD